MYVSNTVRYILFNFLRTRAPVEAFAMFNSPYFLRLAAARRGPLRVRAFVRVR